MDLLNTGTIQVIIHIGLHKTGTTFLQESVWPTISNATVIRGWDSHRTMIDKADKDILLISDESLCGNPWNGTYFSDFKANMTRIKAIYNNPKIIFGVRKQSDLLLSLYKQYLAEKGIAPLHEFYKEDNSGIVKNQDLKLKERIIILKSLFNNIFIYSQETLRDASPNFYSSLSAFMDTDVHVPKTDKKSNLGIRTVNHANILRRINRINAKTESLSKHLSLYNKLLRHAGLTPRHVTNRLIGKSKSSRLDLPKDLRTSVNQKFAADWEYCLSVLSY